MCGHSFSASAISAINKSLDEALERFRGYYVHEPVVIYFDTNQDTPLAGEDALRRLRAEGAEIYLLFSGLDETIGATIHARARYAVDDIIDGGHFADILTVKADGTRVIDYRRFHAIERRSS